MSLRAASGSIRPENPDTNFTNRLRRGEWLTTAGSAIPSACIDGRPNHDGDSSLRHAPRVAGATAGLWIPLLLTIGPQSCPTFEEFTAFLSKSKLPVGGHCDENFGPKTSGCGAADHAKDLFWLIVRNADAVRELVANWGFDASSLDNAMLANAESAPLPPGVELAATIEAHTSIPILRGPHKEQAAVVNFRHGTTSDKSPKQIFHLDAWTFKDIAELIYPEGLTRYEAALAAFNAAALLFLCSPEMPYAEVR